MNQKQDLDVAHDSKLFVAIPYSPLQEWLWTAIFINPIPEIVWEQSHSPLYKEPECDSWNIGEQDIVSNVIPPALSKMWENVLEAQLDHLVKQVPEMQQIEIPDHEGGEKPVAKMDEEVVVEIVHDVLPGEIAVVIICVVSLCHLLIQARIKIS